MAAAGKGNNCSHIYSITLCLNSKFQRDFDHCFSILWNQNSQQFKIPQVFAITLVRIHNMETKIHAIKSGLLRVTLVWFQ